MGDDFQVVKSKKKRCKPRQVFGVPSSSLEDVESVYKKLLKTTTEFENTSFCGYFITEINRSLDSLEKNKIDAILSYGLGKFSQDISSLHQLSALIVISKAFNSSVKVFDPLFDSTEITILKKLNFEVICENEEGKRQIDVNQTTLIYLPHCPKQLTNNFLWANWNSSLRSCIIVSNSFSKIVESHTKRTLQESASYIKKIHEYTDEIKLKNSYYLLSVFNDLSIHYFINSKVNSSFFEGEHSEPKYSTCTEFITKELEKCLKME